jgi:hypothetical protein
MSINDRSASTYQPDSTNPYGPFEGSGAAGRHWEIIALLMIFPLALVSP